MKFYLAIAIIIYSCTALRAQTIQGYVIDNTEGTAAPLTGARVWVLGTVNGTTTNEKGMFALDGVNPDTGVLIVAPFGFRQDTVILKGRTFVTISAQPIQIGTVDITAKKSTRLEMTPHNVEVITGGDLVKDACCNLSESFENSAAVDVNYSDAVSGAKEIRMLGLDGVYTQIMVENVPSIRSLGNTFGLNYVPGPWMSSIQVNKGAGSVVNGYEAITGQINLEFKKPLSAEKLYVNFFVNQDARTELNVISGYKISKKWSGLTALNGSFNWLMMDLNKDGFIDNPLVKNANLFNRFNYTGEKGFSFVGGVTLNAEDRIGGQHHFKPQQDVWSQPYWGLRLTTERVEAFAKTGFDLSDNNFVGIQYKYIFQQQKGYVGRRSYNGLEHFGYLNVIFMHKLSEEHTLKAGLSLELDNVTEAFDTFNRRRMEAVPGVFTEGTFNFGKDDKVSIVIGGRVDYHNMYGPFVTPRANLKWRILYGFDLRLSAGRGYRVPTIFAENFGWLSNNRELVIAPNLKYEEAWNYGVDLSYKFNLAFREGLINVDYYRTDFTNQVVVDMEDTRTLQFYNLQGQSFANAVQADVMYEVIKNFEVKLAYKFEQNKTDYQSGRKIYPLRPQHRGLVSLQYTTKKEHWRFNTSLNWFGKTRIPNTSVNDEPNRRPVQSKDWFQLNAQVTFKWKKWEVYIGGENLLNFSQNAPIISGDMPFSNQFDASLVWGPLRGAMAFAGFRFVIK